MARRMVGTLTLAALGGAAVYANVGLDRIPAKQPAGLPALTPGSGGRPLARTGHSAGPVEPMPQIRFDDYPVVKLPQLGPPAPSGVIRVWGYEGADLQSGGVLRVESQVWEARLSRGVFTEPTLGLPCYPIRRYECTGSGPIAQSITEGSGRTLLIDPP